MLLNYNQFLSAIEKFAFRFYYLFFLLNFEFDQLDVDGLETCDIMFQYLINSFTVAFM